MTRAHLLAATAALAAAVGLAAPPPTTTPPPAEPLAAGPMLTLFVNKCSTCHTKDLVLQQRLTPPQWEKAVKKMSGWGAALSADEQKALAAWLSTSLPGDRPDVEPRRVPAPPAALK